MTSRAEMERALAQQGNAAVRDWITSTQQVPCAAVATTPGQRERTVARLIVGKAAARSWRVTLGPLALTGNPVTLPLGSVPVLARVMWGFDGTRFDAIVDWPAKGTHFNVWGDTVEVSLLVPDSYQLDPVVFAPPQLTAISGAAVIAPAASAGGPSPVRTLYTGTLGPGILSAAIPVPAMATAFRWHQLINLSAANIPIPLFFAGSQDAGALYATFATPNGVYTSSETTWPSDLGITLQPATNFLFVQNAGAGPGDDVSLQLEFVLDME